MQLVDGVHHLTFLTEDMDRLLAFYVRVFDRYTNVDAIPERSLCHLRGADDRCPLPTQVTRGMRSQPDLVDAYFGPEWRRTFCPREDHEKSRAQGALEALEIVTRRRGGRGTSTAGP